MVLLYNCTYYIKVTRVIGRTVLQEGAHYIFVSATQKVFNVSAFCVGILLKGLNNLNQLAEFT